MKQKRLIANNKKARHDYFIDETYEAGIVLTGTEIKSIRKSKVSIKESYARISDGEVFIYGVLVRRPLRSRTAMSGTENSVCI